ncbi:fumarylacetoacetate hydrolase family protein [Roseburia sp. 499]|uniref:fumarylacetoacetate hydrolase family protein n=1 Tax=Roseburia sp. 499 TaxID=1261634 RepID=UPI000950C0B1|nr:fumarylacetoacetate hydrolase family protein [Roseburia sp. 499]WVK68591.1 fumarylacetoacetate hydrolase family protein [Roseburia sp. 499]
MRLLHFYENRKLYLGIWTQKGIINIAKTVAANNSELPTTWNDILMQTENNLLFLDQYLNLSPVFSQIENITFAPSVPNPEKILCIGLNYDSHIKEVKLEHPKEPTIFSKYNTCLTGHNSSIHLPPNAIKFDYEAELVIIIGKKAHNVSQAEALSYVFGYSVGNDFSARDLQMLNGQWLLGKACDEFAPLGPYIVTANEVNPNHLDIKCEVNGIMRQHSNTQNMIFNCAAIISYLSTYITLKPGDIIFTGTPEGVILGEPEEKQQWLKSGDQVTITIEKLGTLSNTLC